jgi:hypothetical protein
MQVVSVLSGKNIKDFPPRLLSTRIKEFAGIFLARRFARATNVS